MTMVVDPSEFQRPFGDCEEDAFVPRDHHIVLTQDPETPRTEEVKSEQPDTPKVGRWYYVRVRDRETGQITPERWLGCVVRLGSNYVKLEDPADDTTMRIHDDEFWEMCEFVENPEQLLRGNAERCRRELDGLMEEVKQLTSKLGVSPSQSLGSGGETQATSMVLGTSAPAAEYKTALVKAKEETLPALFESIKKKSAEYTKWLSAGVIPMKAEAAALKPAIQKVEDRIFSVELYAGLCEEVEQVKYGEPAALTEPVHLFQSRLYMDEECLADFDAGGMEFKTMRKFERWLCRKGNFDRIFPFPRTIVAFQVRHHKKEREATTFRSFIQMMDDEKLDKLTFLYIRNGERLYSLSTAVEFGEKLFPDIDHPVLSAGEGKLYAKLDGKDTKIITEATYQAKVEKEIADRAEYERRVAEENKKPKKDREYVDRNEDHWDGSNRYSPFTRESVQYDDIAKHIRSEMERHNRIVLILQGLLDRSPSLHPHPQWKLFDAAGFGQALVLHRDADRVLVAGDMPDFEAYRARLNASITVGSVTVGQQEAWLRYEGTKESNRRDRSRAWGQVDYRPEKWQPTGDPGPGRFARVARVDSSGHVHYRWTKERRKGDGPPVGRKYGCKAGRVFNIDAYQPGDYKIFFGDRRTRERYLEWAPFLLAAEKFKAGKYEPVAPLAEPPKPKPVKPTFGRSEYAHRQMLKEFLGKAVRLRHPLTTTGKKRYEKDTLWRVVGLERGEFSIMGIKADGTAEHPEGQDYGSERYVCKVPHRDFYIDSSVPVDPEYAYKPEKRERVSDIDRGDD